ncbi:MAG: rhodanese-like domain-containing protein [Chitinophagia bacterium]|nr:rhodanese-like domain-containing protein [Chitinophagia bacterium]
MDTQITAATLRNWLGEGKEIVLIDVREAWERKAFSIGGTHIPLGELMSRKGEIPQQGVVVIYCEKGIRSGITVQRLHEKGWNNLLNLSGGMAAWKAL